MRRETKAFLIGCLISFMVTVVLTVPALTMWVEGSASIELFLTGVIYSFTSGLASSFLFFLFIYTGARRGRL